MPSLEVGVILADRYTIRRFVGRGGMGEVYEAEDALLKQRVALKILSGASLPDEAAVQRFRREVQLARQVTHPNVCRVYDMGCHQTPGDPLRRDVFFLTMELLEGETLFERIRQEGPFDSVEALPIIRQIAEGLAAAHSQGVLHRDLKTSNVILVPSPTGSPPRAVVTDFGLARLQGDGPADGRPSSTAFAGTPEYMSPEQLRGEEITSASDVYSLGVLVYEMVTGTVPYSGASPIATMLKSLSEHHPPSPRLIAPDLSAGWELAIMRCLDQDPHARFSSPLDLLAALSSEAKSQAAVPAFVEIEPAGARPGGRRRMMIAAALAVAAVCAAILLYDRIARRRAGESPVTPAGQPAAVTARPIVALLGFKNLSGSNETAFISTALAEMISTELAASRELRCLPGETIAQIKVDLKLPDAESFSADTLARLRGAGGTRHVIVGSYFASGSDGSSTLRMDLRIQDTETGETTAVFMRQGTVGQMLDLVAEAGSELRESLGLAGLSSEERRGALSERPTRLDAARHYADGLDLLHRFDAAGARESLQKAVDAEPDFPLTHLALSDTWLALGHSSLAVEEAQKAYALSRDLSPAKQLSIEGRYRERSRDWSKAISAYQVIWEEFPDSIEDGLRLAFAQIEAGREADALTTVAALRRLPAPSSEDPRVDLAEAAAAASLGDTQRQYESATRGVARASAMGTRGSLASASLMQGDALRDLHRPAEALRSYELTKGIWAEVGNKPGEVAALVAIASVRQETGELEEAKRMYADARKVFRELGDRKGEAWALSQKAVALRLQEDLGRSAEVFQEALLVAKEAGNDETAAAILNNLAIVSWLHGSRADSKRRIDEALDTCRRMHDPRLECRTALNYAHMLLLDGELAQATTICRNVVESAEKASQDGALVEALLLRSRCGRLSGDLDGASAAAQKALSLSRSRNSRVQTASALHELGFVQYERGDGTAARQSYEESLNIRRERGDESGMRSTRLALAQLDIDDGRADAALTSARSVLAGPSSTRPENVSAVASALLARALLARGDTAGAEEAAQQAVAWLARGAPLETRIAVTLTMATARARAGNAAQARTILTPARDDAKRAGMRILEHEARLVEADLESNSGHADTARQVLAEVSATASRLGLGRILKLAQSRSGT